MIRNDIRLKNLGKLVVEFRTISALAEAAKTSEKYLSALLNGTLLKSGKQRRLGDVVARKLEDAAHKDPGWMDCDHDNGGLIVTRTDLSAEEAELLRLFRLSVTSKRRTLLAVARLKVLED